MTKRDVWEMGKEFEDEVATLAQNLADHYAEAIDAKDKQILRLEDEISDLREDAERTEEYVAKLEQRDYRAQKVDHAIDKQVEYSRRKEPRIPVTTEYMEHGPDKADR